MVANNAHYFRYIYEIISLYFQRNLAIIHAFVPNDDVNIFTTTHSIECKQVNINKNKSTIKYLTQYADWWRDWAALIWKYCKYRTYSNFEYNQHAI